MDVSEKSLYRRYSGMTTGELVELRRTTDLTEMASAVLQHILEQRGVVAEVRDDIVNKIVDKYRDKIEDQRIFVRGFIPDSKLENAEREYADLGRLEVPLVLIDNTVFGSAKEGAILSDARLYARNQDKNPRSIALSDIRSVRFNEGTTSWMAVNGEQFLQFNVPDRKAARCFTEMLIELVGCLYPDVTINESDGDVEGAEASGETWEPSFLAEKLSTVIAVLGITSYVALKSGVNTRASLIAVLMGSAGIVLFWTYWSLKNASFVQSEQKIAISAGWMWFLGVVNTILGLLARFDIWAPPFPVEWQFQIIFGIGFLIVAMVTTKLRNTLTTLVLLAAILVWGADTVLIFSEVVITRFQVEFYNYFMLFFHLIILNSMMNGLRGIRGFLAKTSADEQ